MRCTLPCEDMTAEYIAESRNTIRVAPFVLIACLIPVCFSLIWTTSALWCLALGLVCGVLILLLHAKKWLSGREEYQFVAMAMGFLLMFLMMLFRPGFPQVFQSIGALIAAYYGTVMMLRRKILAWTQS